MVNQVSLNASMRTNLLSLQQISKLQDKTQLRLATGLKVNSAIDNPSSYYTATSLSNRANDLSLLLDAMGQGVQTIQAANEGLETAEALLSLAEVEVKNTLEKIEIPSKEYFESQVGENGAVVSTTEELIDAVNSGKEEICVYGTIRLSDTSLTLKDNQKLVGTEYYTGYSGQEKFSKLEINLSSNYNGNSPLILSGNNTLSDIAIEGNIDVTKDLIYVNSSNKQSQIRNIDINAFYSKPSFQVSAINIYSSGAVLSGHINIQSIADDTSLTTFVHGIYCQLGQTEISSDAVLNIKSTGYSYVTYGYTHIQSGAKLNLHSEKRYGLVNGYTKEGYDKIKQDLIIDDNVEFYICSDSDPAIRNIVADNISFQFGKNVKFSYKDPLSEGVKVTSKAGVLDVAKGYLTGSDLPAEYFTQTSQVFQEANIAEILEQKTQDASKYNDILSQYDMLINDSSYKGVNLLKEGVLKINFNEDKSSNVLISGVNVTSENLGLKAAEWKTQSDVQTTLNKIQEAKEKLRAAASELGNYYSIITTREDFTNRLINVLEEGADKLTLADMNEESANMLSLQTQQQLAINSLSLASQASQAVLRLF